jgi:acyl-CoA thioesterase FadM
MEYLKEIGLWSLDPREQGPILVAESMNFRRQLTADQSIEVGVRISEARRRSYVMEVVMRDGQGNTVADGNCVIAWVDYASQKAVAIPERIRELVKS